ncbi:MAG: hydroxylamine reductase, partial [Clostridia bacterium]|nr:hydroxylamine reductase [Clostridia bacterium]
FQCEQTAGGKGCMGKMGVCGKPDFVANHQDELLGALVGLARARLENKRTKSSDLAMIEGLFTTITNVNFDDVAVVKMIERVNAAKQSLGQSGENYDMRLIWQDNEDIRSLKTLLLLGMKGMAAYACHADALGYHDNSVMEFFYKGMLAIGSELGADVLLPMVMELGMVNLKCIELLDKANTETYGTPVPTVVPLTIEKGPFIIITGHDLLDLQALLEQTKDKGINIYTHGEMLPAHGYPLLKKYAHLKGNFGTAWQNQQREFAAVPAPILFTTNCIMPVKESYKDRVFTTGVVAYPEMMHIGEDRDFGKIIEKALELGGYPEDTLITGINGGAEVTTGFGHGAVLSSADKIVNAVKNGKIKHFFLVGGCDGARPGRNYYTDFVKKSPQDTIILTLACGKYRFNDLNLGAIDGLPRILDMGQCNDSYGAIKLALALSEAFKCSVNELPLTLMLSWYEQKAVCVLLTLLALGIKNIYLGPTLPAFISASILKYLVDNFNVMPISSPDVDMVKILKQ